MGKAKILSGGTDGLYRIEVQRNIKRMESRKAEEETSIDNAREYVQLLEDNEQAALSILNTAALNEQQALQQYKDDMLSQGSSSVDLAQYSTAVMQAGEQLDRIRSDIKAEQIKIKSAESQIALIDKELAKKGKAIDAWCADFNEDLTGDVGTIEINGTGDHVLIKPKGAAYSDASDGQLQPVLANTPAGTFLNLALKPGWQKWMPTYRAARITALYEGSNMCDVSLMAAASDRQNLNINLKTSYTGVEIDYMECGDSAFEVGDDVVVQFVGQNPDQPKVIGFLSNPKACQSETGLVWYNPATEQWKLTDYNENFIRYLDNGPVRPVNSHLSGINGAYTLWRDAARKPDVTRTAPIGFSGSGEPVASHRYYDDADRVWWIVITAPGSGSSLQIWLHQPAADGAGDRQLGSVSVPAHLVGEPITVTANPRGNKAVLQIITDKSEQGAPAVGEALERYTVPWAQFIRVLDFSGTGSWPEASGDPAWGAGLHCEISFYVSPYSSGEGSLSCFREACDFELKLGSIGSLTSSGRINSDSPEDSCDYYNYDATYEHTVSSDPYSGDFLRMSRQETVSAPALIMFDNDRLIEITADISASDTSEPSVSPDTVPGSYGEAYYDTGHVWEGGGASSSAYLYREIRRDAAYHVQIKVNGVTAFNCNWSASRLVYADRDWRDDAGTYRWRMGYGAKSYDYHVNDFVYDRASLPIWRALSMPFFHVVWDSGSYALIHCVYTHSSSTGNYTISVADRHRLIVDRFGSFEVADASGDEFDLLVVCDRAGRRLDIPAEAVSSRSDAGDGTDIKDIQYYIFHNLNGSLLQRGLLFQWKDYNKWLAVRVT